jgi:hypothetical protein
MKIIEKAVDVPGEIPDDVTWVFVSSHIVHVWPALERLGLDRFRIASDMWRLRNQIAPDSADSVWILYYGFHYIQPLMNEKLNRPANYPSWSEILQHELRDIIRKDRYLKNRRKEQEKNKMFK